MLVLGDVTVERRLRGRLLSGPDGGAARLRCERVDLELGGAGRIAWLAARAGHGVTLASALPPGPATQQVRTHLDGTGIDLVDLPVDDLDDRVSHEHRTGLPSPLARRLQESDVVVAAPLGGGLLRGVAVRGALALTSRPLVWVEPAARPVGGATAVLTDETALTDADGPVGMEDGYLGDLTVRGRHLLARWSADAVGVQLRDDGLLWIPRAGDCTILPVAVEEPDESLLASVAVTVAATAGTGRAAQPGWAGNPIDGAASARRDLATAEHHARHHKDP